MATVKDQVYMYCKDNERLFKNLSKNQIAKKVVRDLGVPYNTSSKYVQEYYKNIYVNEGEDLSLSDGVMTSLQEAFIKSGYVVPEVDETVEDEDEVKVECNETINDENTSRKVAENKLTPEERLDRTTVNVGFMSGSNFIGRFELTPYRVVHYVPQGKDEQGNRKESAKLFFDNEEDLDTFYRDMKKLFQLQQILKGE